jgi:hypothetical protein
MSFFSTSINVFEFPNSDPALDTSSSVREWFADHFSDSVSQVELLARITIGHFVIDHEINHDLFYGSYQTVTIYEVIDELIQRIWFTTERNFKS